jgi:uncharacterized protein YyaL (SSP411 family)
VLTDAERGLRQIYDPRFGGFGAAPKFPPASVIEFLLREHLRTGSADALAMALGTLDGMALGGMFDVIGGGFARYSVDNIWLVPHFEKMLYDNALLAAAYLHAHMVTGEGRYRRVVELTLDFLLRELRLEEGLFASSLDADTDGVEGATYVWTPADLHEVLGEQDAAAAAAYYGVEEPGNFEGATILRPQGDPPDNLEDIRLRLLAARDRRPQPARDDKAIAAWNGLALAALAECGRALDRRDWIDAARGLGEFLLGPLSTAEGRLHRTWRDGVAKGTGYLEDYANVANGLYELHVATGELRWLEEANRLARLALDLFADEELGGFFATPVDGERLVARKKDFDDQPAPSGNSMLAYVLVRLARIWGDEELERRAESALRLVAGPMTRVPSAFGWALVALDLHLATPRELAIVGPRESEVARAALSRWDPRAVVACGPSDDVPLLAGKGLVDGRPAVYVCERFACRAPVTDPAGFAEVT